MIFSEFFDNVNNFPDKTAFIYYEKNKIISKTYQEFLIDIKKALTYLQKKGIQENDLVLMLMLPCYEFYVFMLANFCLKAKTVIIDKFKDQKKLANMISLATPKVIVANKKTALLKKFIKPLKGIKVIRVAAYKNALADEGILHFSIDSVALITFTSGSTGKPKAVARTIEELIKQLHMLSSEIDNFEKNDIVLTLLPIYVLFNIAIGVTTVLFFNNLHKKRHLKKLYILINKANVNAINGSVGKYLCFNKPLPNITRVFTGGSIIFPRDAEHLKYIFNQADIVYVYGATEAAMISKTNLNDYLKNLIAGRFCLGKLARGIDVLFSQDHEIMLAGENLTKNYLKGSDNANCKIIEGKVYLPTGDLGYLENEQLYLLGRKNFSNVAQVPCIYNYLLELKILNEFPQIKKVAFIVYKGENIIIVENIGSSLVAELSEKYSPIRIIRLKSIPVDDRHNYKVDYKKLTEKIGEREHWQKS